MRGMVMGKMQAKPNILDLTSMSRIGKKTILMPEGVTVEINDCKVTVRGPKGALSRVIRPEIQAEVKEGKIFVVPRGGLQTRGEAVRRTNAFWGLTRALLANMVEGVVRGCEKKLQIEGIGHRASLEGNCLILQVGFTRPVRIEAPEGVKFSVEKNIITVSGIDKELVSQLAAKIRKVKPPEPYKGKGIRYVGEKVRKKVGKKAVAAAG